MTDLEPFETLFDVTSGDVLPLPPRLLDLYGSLRFPTHSGRPHVVGNFVTSMDGVVSLGIPGNASGKSISGGNPHDRMVMGLLRAAADAVIAGAGTFRSSSGHQWTPGTAFPPLDTEFQTFRRMLGKARSPLNVVVTAGGDLDLSCVPTNGVPYLIVTTSTGVKTLQVQSLPPSIAIVDAGVGPLSSDQIIEAVAKTHPSTMLLVEAGPRLMTSFIADRSLDELFLTIAPQIAGRDGLTERPGFVAGKLFAPDDSRWARLDAARRAGNYLFLRYSFPQPEPGAAKH